MKNILNFNDYINEKFIHSGLSTIDETIDLRDYDCLYQQDSKSVKEINKILRDNKYKLIKLFHGTSPNIPVMEEGLKTTKLKTKKSLQSEVGYVYLSLYPDSAKTFGNMAYGINDSIVYEIHVPIIYLNADKDQLFNKRRGISDIKIGDTLGDSAIYGSGFRVKGDIPPYMISVYKF